MATKYVNSGAGGTATGDSWTDAYLTLGAAVTAGADLIKVHNAHSEALAADTTYTITVDTRVVCVNKDSSDALSTGAIIGNQATNYGIVIAGAFKLYCYGLTFRNGTGASNKNLVFGQTDSAHYEFESCAMQLTGTATNNSVFLGSASSGVTTYIRILNGTFKWSAGAQRLTPGNFVDLEGATIDQAGSKPTAFFINYSGARVRSIGCDYSWAETTLVADSSTSTGSYFEFSNCKFASAVVIKAAATGVLNKGNTTVYAVDCTSGDTHYSLYHSDAFGTTTAVTDYYYTSGGASIGSSFSWKIVTTANCSFYHPYVSPWFHRAHTGTSAITVSLEGLRLSTTVIQDDEVWGEFSYKGTSGSVITTLVNDRQDVGARANGTAASDQTSGVTYTAWTNGTSSHSAFKLTPASTITPAEVGVLSARVVVGEPSLTVYVDPNIRVV